MSEELTNGKMLKEIFERVVRLDERQANMDGKLDNINEVFKPDGLCSKSRGRINSMFSHIKIQWWLLGSLVIFLVVRQFV